jgi:hypothetical protein
MTIAASNDNDIPRAAISLSDLAVLAGLDEDTQLQRIAAVLAKREDPTE